MPTHDDQRRGPQDDEGQERDEDDRQRQERLDDPAQDVIDRSAIIAHDETEQRPGGHAKQCSQRSEQENVPGADHDPGEHITTQSVRAHQILGARRQMASTRREIVERIVRRDAFTEDRGDDPADDDDVADDECGPPDEDRKGLPARLGPL
jgi:hypothetical protein